MRRMTNHAVLLLTLTLGLGGCEHDDWSGGGDGGTDLYRFPDLPECKDNGMSAWDNATANVDGSYTIDAWGVQVRIPSWPYTVDMNRLAPVPGTVPRYLVLYGDPNNPCVTGALTTGVSYAWNNVNQALVWYQTTAPTSPIERWWEHFRTGIVDDSTVTITYLATQNNEANGSRPAHLFGMWLGAVTHEPSDIAWLNRMVTPSAVASGPGPGVYAYRVVPSDSSGNPKVGIVGPKATVTGPATLGSGGANVALSWSAVTAITGVPSFYAVFRTASGASTNASGLVAVVTTTNFTDTGTIMVPNATAEPEVSDSLHGVAAPLACWTMRSGNVGARHIAVRYRQESSATIYPHLGAFINDLQTRATALSDSTGYDLMTVMGPLFMLHEFSDVRSHYPPRGR